ncbi:peptidoglycan-binding protein [Leifsonia sp. NPDC056665]|uniref:peptidoglycan-binding protein n=1 Tax=Leifsonia sp. NPDC056665 TaxID=3345901 RepID=UPI00367A2ADD
MRSGVLPRFLVIAVAATVLFASGATAAWLWWGAEPPSSLAPPKPAGAATVSYREFFDQRTVSLRIESAEDSRLESGVGGRVTSSACSPGAVIESGSVIAAIDGRPLVALATAPPLWRDLRAGDNGDDVRALQKELARLGYPVTRDGTVGKRTLDAVARLFERAGDAAYETGAVEAARIVWLPSKSVTVGECTVSIGETVEARAALASVAGAITRVSADEPNAGVVPGQRTLTVDAITVPVDDSLSVSDPTALGALGAAPSVVRQRNTAMSETGADAGGTLRGTLALASPVDVGIVPPAAVHSITGQEGCVATGQKALRVTIVGSQLGQTYVLFDGGERPDTVQLSESRRPSCS